METQLLGTIPRQWRFNPQLSVSWTQGHRCWQCFMLWTVIVNIIVIKVNIHHGNVQRPRLWLYNTFIVQKGVIFIRLIPYVWYGLIPWLIRLSIVWCLFLTSVDSGSCQFWWCIMVNKDKGDFALPQLWVITVSLLIMLKLMLKKGSNHDWHCGTVWHYAQYHSAYPPVN